jgi:tyrosine-specific transport protein 1
LPYKVWGGKVTLMLVLVLGVIITSIPFAIRAGYLPFVVG